jgi:hypothetical protein
VGSEKNSIFLIIFVSLIAATALSAAPIITYGDNLPVTSPVPNTHILEIPGTSKITEIYNSVMAAIGTDILIPPAEFTNSPSAGAGTFHPHATVFIVLSGFLCVSLVIDRKLWLATLTTPLRSVQSEFHSIPQLAGIPAGTITFQPNIFTHDKIRQKQNIQHAIHITNAVLRFAIKHFSSLHKPTLICMALSYEQNQSFSPAFIFARLARGPPILT